MNTSWAGGAPRKRADATSIFVAHSLSFCGEVLRRVLVLYPAVLRSSLAVPVSSRPTGLNIESFAALGSGPCQHCSYLCSHSRPPLMRPIEIPENRAG